MSHLELAEYACYGSAIFAAACGLGLAWRKWLSGYDEFDDDESD